MKKIKNSSIYDAFGNPFKGTIENDEVYIGNSESKRDSKDSKLGKKEKGLTYGYNNLRKSILASYYLCIKNACNKIKLRILYCKYNKIMNIFSYLGTLSTLGITIAIVGTFIVIASMIALLFNKNTFYSLHVAAISDALGAPLALFGLSIFGLNYSLMLFAKILLMACLIWLVNPINAYIFTKIVYFLTDENIDPNINTNTKTVENIED